MSSDDPIQCELIEVSLDNLRSGTGVRFQTKDTLRANAIKYDALSYAWGSPEPARWIECEGLPIRVTDNCYTAMKRLQSSHTQPSLRFLWIDSICIDQRSPQERSQQVAMMGEVYRKAQRVIVWLGQEDEYSREAIKHLRGIQKYVKRHPDPFFKTEAMLKQTPRDYNKGRYRESIEALTDRPWFDRVWPVQEVALAKQCVVYCGPEEMHWHELNDALRHLHRLSIPSDPYYKLHMHRKLSKNVRQFGKRPCRMKKCSDLFLLARHLKATEPQDKIFAFHSVLGLLGVQLPVPDYAASIEIVYRQAAMAAMKYDRSPELLTGTTGSSTIADLPSWVPDWSDTEPMSDALHWDRCKAAGDSRWLSTVIGNRLVVRGTSIDIIKHISAPVPNAHRLERKVVEFTGPTTGWLQAVRVFRSWLNTFPKDCGIDYKGVIKLLLHVTKAACDENEIGRRSPIYSQLGNWARIIRYSESTVKWLKTLDPPPRDVRMAAIDKPEHAGVTSSVEYKIYAALQKFWSTIELHLLLERLLDRKRIFRTEEKRLGLASMEIATGDEIFLLSGSNVPIVLRRVKSEWNLYRCIGPAWVEGVMHGEQWSKASKELDRLKII